MKKFLTFLRGKKTTIATIIGAIITFSLTRGYIDGDLANLLATIMIALGFTVNYATSKMR